VASAEETDKIETSTLVQSAERGVGRRYVVDEHAFSPVRAKVTPGTTVTFTNNGQVVHTIVAQDGSWNTGSLVTAESDYVKFDKPGTYVYHCKEHPWAIGQIVVE
jgi:plastocyanin